MNASTAKSLLASYRSDIPEITPGLVAALQLVDDDPEVQCWFEAEQQFDQEMTNSIQAIAVPPQLREDILDGAGEAKDEIIQPTFTITRNAAWLSIAALFLVVFSFMKYTEMRSASLFQRSEFVSVDAFREDMAYFASQRFVLDHKTDSIAQTGNWLDDHQRPHLKELPTSLAGLTSMGCKAIDWGEHKVGLICFTISDNELVNLFVIEKSAFQDLTAPSQPLEQLLVTHQRETGGWIDEQHVYLLVGAKPNIEIGSFLRRVPPTIRESEKF